jgi:hypothetical protein
MDFMFPIGLLMLVFLLLTKDNEGIIIMRRKRIKQVRGGKQGKYVKPSGHTQRVM